MGWSGLRTRLKTLDAGDGVVQSVIRQLITCDQVQFGMSMRRFMGRECRGHILVRLAE